MTTTNPGIGATVSLADLVQDPYPTFARLRREEPVAWVPAANRYLVTRYADVVWLEQHPETFVAAEENSLMTRVMGLGLLRQDGAAHRRLRAAAESALRPRTVKEHWLPVFEANTAHLLEELAPRGQADLFTSYAGPLAARNLAAVLGLRDVPDHDLQTWSQALMDGTGNYADDPAVWARARAAARGVEEAVDAVLPYLRSHPDPSVISGMLRGDDPLTADEIYANIKVIIGGGLNEPRDAMLVAGWAVLSNPDVRAEVDADPSLWKRVFEEALRWIAPIGMYPREVAAPVELGGVQLRPGDRLGVCLGSANRDETVFDEPDVFSIRREVKPHVAFGGGPHYCLGTWVARAEVAQIALPRLFGRLPGLRLSDTEPVRLGGWVFRGLLTLPVEWDA